MPPSFVFCIHWVYTKYIGCGKCISVVNTLWAIHFLQPMYTLSTLSTLYNGRIHFTLVVYTLQWLYEIYNGCIHFYFVVYTLQWLYENYKGCMKSTMVVYKLQWVYTKYNGCKIQFWEMKSKIINFETIRNFKRKNSKSIFKQ